MSRIVLQGINQESTDLSNWDDISGAYVICNIIAAYNSAFCYHNIYE